jgi:hypothetical protein
MPRPRGLVVTLTQGKAENSINADEDEEEDENAQDDDIAKEVERRTFSSQHAWCSVRVVPSSFRIDHYSLRRPLHC